MTKMIKWYLNKFPCRHGKSHLFKLFRDRLIRDGPVRCGYDDDLVILADLEDWLQRQIFMYGVYRVEERHRHFMLAQVSDGDTVLDVGAHVGYYSLMFAKRVGTRGRVIAFEPAAATRQRLMTNIELNVGTIEGTNGTPRIAVAGAAASDRAGEATLYLSDKRNTGSSSLHLGHAGCATARVPTIVLDDYLAEQGVDGVDLVKIDVEGHELAVLRGLRNTLSQSPHMTSKRSPKLFVEINAETLAASQTPMDAVFEELGELGYQAHKIVDKQSSRPVSQPFTDSLVYFCRSRSD